MELLIVLVIIAGLWWLLAKSLRDKLVPCRTCGQVISGRAQQCPKCGAPQRGFMAVFFRVFAGILAAVFCLFVYFALVIDDHPRYAIPAQAQITPADRIMSIQRGLASLGYYSGQADGVAGPKTTDAISRFRADHGPAEGADVTDKLFSLYKAMPPVVDILAIAGKQKDEVSSIIGKPSACSTIKYGLSCRYAKNGVEKIVFINGVADWITIDGIGHVAYGPDAIRAIGLATKPATFQNEHVIRWENIGNLLSVSVFPLGMACDYAYVKVFTE